MKVLSTYTSVLCFFLSLAVVGSCTKKGNSSTDESTWTFGTTSYKTGFTTFSTGLLGAYTLYAYTKPPSASPGMDRIAILFRQKPTASGNYKIVYKKTGDDLAVDEIAILGNEEIGVKTLYALGEGKTATVTIRNGKIKVVVPTVSAQYEPALYGSYFVPTTIRADITEQ